MFLAEPGGSSLSLVEASFVPGIKVCPCSSSELFQMFWKPSFTSSFVLTASPAHLLPAPPTVYLDSAVFPLHMTTEPPNSITLSPHSLPLTLWNFLLKTQVRSWLLCNPGLLLTLSDMLLRCARAGSWLPGASCPNSWKLSLCQLCMGSGSVRM